MDLAGIGNLLEHLVAESAITCEERERIIRKIAKDNDLSAHMLPILAGYGRSKDDVLEQVAAENRQCYSTMGPMKVMFL